MTFDEEEYELKAVDRRWSRRAIVVERVDEGCERFLDLAEEGKSARDLF